MHLDEALQGHLVAAIVEVLLVDAGYQVIPTGIERSIREIRAVDVDLYRTLAHPRLRSAPDFFVLDLEAREGRLTEIKFRHYLHPLLLEDLRAIQRDWSPFLLILAAGEPPPEWTGLIRHIRAFHIGADTTLDSRFLATAGQRLQDLFPRLGERWRDETILKAQDAILRITARN